MTTYSSQGCNGCKSVAKEGGDDTKVFLGHWEGKKGVSSRGSGRHKGTGMGEWMVHSRSSKCLLSLEGECQEMRMELGRNMGATLLFITL